MESDVFLNLLHDVINKTLCLFCVSAKSLGDFVEFGMGKELHDQVDAV